LHNSNNYPLKTLGSRLDYSNSYFELRHPYLIHPYLSETLLSKLIDKYGIAGIGSDTYCLENPMRFSQKHNIPPFARNYYKKFNEAKDPYPPILVKLLTERLLYICNLKNLALFNNNLKLIYGKITIIPFPFGNRDSNLVRVFFKNEEII